jgi:hypothetical protein
MVMQAMGFRILGFEYDKSILNGGDPTLLLEAISSIKDAIESDAETHDVAGIYGMSLGAYIGFNVLKRTNIDRAIFNTGGVSIVDTVWHSPSLVVEKHTFEQAGFTYKDMQRLWSDIDKPRELSGDKKALLMISSGDKVISPEESMESFAHWQASGVDGALLRSRILGHGEVIVRNLFRLKRTKDFFAKP